MQNEVLVLENIVKSFPGVLALNGIDFTLKAGEIHAICGENGAGKSTLMKVVCGVHKPDCGNIIVEGNPTAFKSPLEAYKNGVSIIFQEGSLFEEMTVLDNLFLGHEITKKVGFITSLDYKSMGNRAQEIFQKLNSDIDLNNQIKNLGMSQKQMVEIAKALTFNSKIIIFDEPTASLTEREVKALFEIIRKLRDENIGIVYISHRMEEIFQLCDRVTVIRDGQYISTMDIEKTNKDLLVADMVGREMGNYYPKTETKIAKELLRVENFYDEGFLQDVSFHVKKGEILGIAGLAGAGRTELMEALCGLKKKAAGRVYLEGQEINVKNYRDAMNYGIVYVSEDRGKYGLITDLSIEKNITLPQLQNYEKKFSFLNLKKEKKIGEKYINDLAIKAPGAAFIVGNLSGGNQQKISVSKALALNPKILILDEPTRGVDVNAKAEIHKIISELTAGGLTIIMISSELPELLGMCDRIYVMKDGYIGGSFKRGEMSQEEILKVALESKRQVV